MTVTRLAAPAPARPAAVPLRPIPVHAQIQRCGGVQCTPGTCDHDEGEKVHRFADGTPGPARIPATVAAVLRTPGQALDPSTRAGMEERFGHDFGQVRVHTDAEAARSAQAIHAQAYTLGRHVVMGQGRYQPHTASGMRLLAHELTHVVQQGNPATDTGPAGAISHPHDPSEREADHVAGALTGSPGTHAPPGLLQRQDDDDVPFGGGDFGGGGAGGTFGAPTGTGPAATRPFPMVCSRPLDFPPWTGLRNFRHAYINDPPANYAIRDLKIGNGVTTSCATATDASGPPDEPATSVCKPCQPAPGQSVDDVSSCLRSTHAAYPSPNLYRNLPDPSDGWRHGPNSNSYAAAMARCCHDFSPVGLGRLPGWDHSPALPCPINITPGGTGSSEEPRDAGVPPAAGVGPSAGEDAAPTDLHAFGNRAKPRDPRLNIDIDPNPDGTVGPEPKEPPWPSGASTFGDPDRSGLTGHYHQIVKGTRMAAGLRVIADGRDVGGPAPETHHTIFPSERIHFQEFVDKFQGLGWAYAGKK